MKFMLLNERQDLQGSCASSFAGSLDVYIPSTGFATAHFGDIPVSIYSMARALRASGQDKVGDGQLSEGA